MADRQLIFLKACDLGDSLVAIDEIGSGMFRIDKRDMSVHLLDRIENMGMLRHVYRAVEQCDNKIFFFPAYQSLNSPLLVYHIDEQHTEYLSWGEISQNISVRYGEMQRVKDELWLFPEEFDKHLIKFNLKNRTTDIIPQWNKAVENIVISDTDTYIKVSNVIETQTALFHVIKETNNIIEINKENCHVNCHTVSTDKKFFIRMDYNGELFWITDSKNQGVISWNPITQETHYYPFDILSENLPKRDRWGKWVSHVLCGKKHLWIVPQRDGKLLKMSYETGRLEWVDIFPQKFHIREGNSSSIGMIIRDRKIADLYPHFSNLVIHLDLDEDLLLEEHEEILLPGEWSEEELVNYQVHYELETDRLPFEKYLISMMQDKDDMDKESDTFNSGESIWHYIKNQGSD